MKKFLPIIFLLFSVNCYATTYYVDSVGGSDANVGTDTLHPWQTITKVNTQLSTGLNPGDQVLFLAGKTWNTNLPLTLVPQKDSGTLANRVLIGSYGVGAIPIFDGVGTQTACVSANGADNNTLVPPFAYITVTGIECKNTTQYGVYFHNQGQLNWVQNHVYGANSVIQGRYIFGNTNASIFKTTAGGTSNNTGESTWCITAGCTVTDGTVTWVNLGLPGGLPGINVTNMNIHQTGPNAWAGGTGAFDDLNYRNQLMLEDDDSGIDNFQVISNTVDRCGGHNCIQVQGDLGTSVVSNNTCYNWVHNCIDAKMNQVTLFQSNVITGPASSGAAMYYENSGADTDFPTRPVISYRLNLVYQSTGTVNNGIQCEEAFTASGVLTCNVVYNTLSMGSTNTAIASATTNNFINMIVEGNILDTTAPLFVCNANNNNSCGTINYWDYNDDGGSAGNPSSPLVVQGAHDLVGIDPQYVNSSSDFRLKNGSPAIDKAPLNIIGGHDDMGAYEFVAGSSDSIRVF